MSREAGWQLQVLGPVRVVERATDELTPVLRPQSARVLCALAAVGDGHASKQALADAVWPSAPAVDGGALRVAVNRARQYFGADGPQSIVGSSFGYRLEPGLVRTDLDEWRSLLAQAVDTGRDPSERAEAFLGADRLWRGEPFDGVLEGWQASSLVSALAIERNAAATNELTLLLELDVERAAHRARHLVSVNPLHEPTVVLAMEALGRTGHAAGALALARDLRDLLRDEMGLSPSPAIDDAERRWLAPRARSDARPDSVDAPPVEAGEQDREILGVDPPPATAVESFALAQALEAAGRPEAAGALFSRAVALADPSTDGDLIVTAALGGAAHASRIGGDVERRNRLRVAMRRLADHPRRDEVIADLALEAMNCRLPLDDDVRAEAQRIAADPASPGYVLALRWQVSEWQIDGRASSADAVALARSVLDGGGVDVHHASAALAVAVAVAIGAGELVLAEEYATEFEYLGVATGQARALWQATAYRTILAEMQSRSDLADEFAGRALDIGRSAGMADAEATFGLHLAGRAWRTGSLAGFAPTFAAAAERYRFPIWSMFRAVAELDAGHEGVARQLLVGTFDELFEQREHFTPAARALATRVAVRLGDRGRASALADALGARADQFVLVGYGGPCLGPVAMFRAEVADLCGDDRLAAELRSEATAMCRRVGAVAWLELPGQA